MSEQRLCDLCDTFIYSESVGHQRGNAKRYMSERLGYPDQGSNFDKELGKLKYLFRIPGINGIITLAGLWHLQRQGYDALLLGLADEIIGHTAFQIHKDDSLHIFSVEVIPKYQGNGLAQYMVEKTLGEARKRLMQRMRIGGGKHEATNCIHHHFAERADELRIVAREGNWVDILY